MKHPKFLPFALLALSTIMASCMSAEPGSGPQDDEIQNNVHFLRWRPSDAPELLAPLRGRLVLSDRCLYVQSDDAKASYAAIWPFEFSLAVQGSNIQILNGDKDVVAQVGDQIQGSGGQANLSPEEFEANVIGTAECIAPYWGVNSSIEVVKP